MCEGKGSGFCERRGHEVTSPLDLSAFGSSPCEGEPRHTATRRQRGNDDASSGAGGLRFAARSEPLGTGQSRTASYDVRPGGRPGVSFRRHSAFAPFSGWRESAARRRRGYDVTSPLDLSAFGSSPCEGEPRHMALAGSAAMMILLREPEGGDSQPGASPWARAKAEQAATMCARVASPVLLSAAIQLSCPLADGEKAQPAGDAAMM